MMGNLWIGVMDNDWFDVVSQNGTRFFDNYPLGSWRGTIELGNPNGSEDAK